MSYNHEIKGGTLDIIDKFDYRGIIVFRVKHSHNYKSYLSILS